MVLNVELNREELKRRSKYIDQGCYPTDQPIITVNQSPCRVVPPFSIQSLQKNTVVAPLPKSKPPKPYPVGQSSFRTYYKRGDFPIAMEFDQYGGFRVAWKATTPVEELDYTYYLPIFFDGLTETDHPYKFFAQQGIHDLLTKNPNKVLPVIPQIILPIKNALNTRNVIVISTTLKVLQDLVTSVQDAGPALVPYYRQILAPLNFLKEMGSRETRSEFSGDDIDYGQKKKESLVDLIQETLEVLERTGGPDAFINIKYMIPTYESCLKN